MKYIYILIIFFSFGKETLAQNERFKALFVYNFTKNIEWPADYKQGDLVITVLGHSPVYTELSQNVAGKRAGNQVISVIPANNLSSIGRTHVLYIPAAQSNLLGAVISQLNGRPTVIITEKNGMMNNGSDINIIQVDGKIQFEINPQQLNRKNLQVTQNLIRLGIVQGGGITIGQRPKLESVDDASIPK